ncbi:putative disease resistance RPP13-like protein 1 [Medicago truncatula]|uniref:putative disease resistance RPP13-like protein 1 n=1 Tax=Medicago truncatula TaxID=3880 RepID=UPI000D2F425F|nr:putative disease resistance RPP13-like protein 1 [Medicago truncatula]
MELETPGGAIASSFFEALIDKLSSAETMDENLHSRLITALFSINVVADDAEKKQIDNFHVKEWLLGVKDGVLDAQDLVEEIHIQVSKSKQEVAESQTSSTRTNQLLEMMTKQLSLIGAQGEVATRSGEVALVTASDQIHQLHHLDEEDSWTLFAKHAFHGFDDSYAVSWTKKTTLHEKVGKKVADKCKGLPLALIAIGNLLRRNSSLQHWEKISESDAWDLAEGNRIVPALMVSYQSLPTHLKKCFEYCALFPKGYLYEKDQLCLLWMAENLIQRPRQHMTSMKEVAESYFNDLILRSFFQPSTKYRNYFVMHDLHHDLSKSIFGEFCFTWEGRKSKNMTSITRHFSFLCDEIGSPKGLETLFDAKKLRTFLPLSMTCFEYQWLLCFNSNKLLLSELFSKCKRLRVLSLCGCMDMIELPDNIGNLKHLHHLDLSRTKISKLPDTLCSLHYLQTLKVRDCQFLEELPMNLHKLVNLCYLDFSGTKVTVMPKEMGKLKNLEVLSSFYVGKGNDSSMMDLSVYVYFVT